MNKNAKYILDNSQNETELRTALSWIKYALVKWMLCF